MTWDLFVQLIGHLAWPLVAGVGIVAFRRQIMELMQRAREFEGPGGFKLSINPKDVKAVAEQVTKGTMTPEEAAERLEQAALDRRAYRILRALLDEDRGRNLYGYATYEGSYYGSTIRSLLQDDLIDRRERKYYLTPKGLEILRAYLSKVLDPAPGNKPHPEGDARKTKDRESN